MSDFRKFKEELLKDPEVRAEYDALKPEYEGIRTLVGARIEQNLTQEQLAQRTGIRQSNISRIESGTCSQPDRRNAPTAREWHGKEAPH